MNMDEKQRIDLRVSETAFPEEAPVPKAEEPAQISPIPDKQPEKQPEKPSNYREFRKQQKDKARLAGATEGAKRIKRLLVFGAGITAIMITMLGLWFFWVVNAYKAQYVAPAPPVIAAKSPADAARQYSLLIKLQPDRSFQAAFSDVATLTGQSLQPPPLDSSETYAQKLAALHEFARQCVEKAKIQKGATVDPGNAPSFGIKALLDDLSSIDKKLGAGTISGAIAAQASRDLAELDYISPNNIGGNEPVVGRALALAAIAAATGQDVAATDVALALDMNYTIEARSLAQSLPASNLWRLKALNQVKKPADFYRPASIAAGDPARAFIRLHDDVNFWARAALDERALSMLNDVLERKPLTNGLGDVPSDEAARDIAERLDSGTYNAEQIARLQRNLDAARPSGRLLDQKILKAYFNTYFYGLIFDVADQLEYGFGSYDMIHDLQKSLGKAANMQAPAAELAHLLELRGWSRPVSEYEGMLRQSTSFGNGMRASEFTHLRAIDDTGSHTRYAFSLLLRDLDATQMARTQALVAAGFRFDPYAAREFIQANGATVVPDNPPSAIRKHLQATPAMLSEAAQKAESWREADLLRYGDMLRDSGKLDQAYKIYDRSLDRYGDSLSMSRIMGVLWRQGKPDAAAKFLFDQSDKTVTDWTLHQVDTNWTTNYGAEFADVFASNPEAGQKAFDSLVARNGMSWSYYEGIATNFATRGDWQNAFKYQSQLTSRSPMYDARNRLIAYDYLRKLKGEPEAAKWLKATIAKSPKLADSTQFAVPALATRIFEPLWTVLPVRPTDPETALIWEARAAAEAAQPGLADKTGGHLKDLKAWAEKAGPASKYYLGMLSEADLVNATTQDAAQLRLVCIALGWKAEAAGDMVNAAKWYAIAANVGPQNIPDFVDVPVMRMRALFPQVIAKK